MKKTGLLILGGCLLLISTLCVADITDTKVIKPSIILNHIDPIKTKEIDGEELYFDITVMRANEPHKFYRIPQHPIHWPSLLSKKIKELTLWSEEMKPGSSVILLISLMDQDTNPLNPDDLIGIIRVELMNKNGELNIHWTIPNRPTGPVTIVGKKGDVQKFELYSEHGQYDVFLSLQK